MKYEIRLHTPGIGESGVLDRTKIQELLDLDKDTANSLVIELIRLFKTTAPRRVREMRLALVRSDLKTLEREAHTLKSSAGNLGAFKVRKASIELEALVTVEPVEKLNQLIDTIEGHLNDAISELRLLIADEESVA